MAEFPPHIFVSSPVQATSHVPYSLQNLGWRNSYRHPHRLPSITAAYVAPRCAHSSAQTCQRKERSTQRSVANNVKDKNIQCAISQNVLKIITFPLTHHMHRTKRHRTKQHYCKDLYYLQDPRRGTRATTLTPGGWLFWVRKWGAHTHSICHAVHLKDIFKLVVPYGLEASHVLVAAVFRSIFTFESTQATRGEGGNCV